MAGIATAVKFLLKRGSQTASKAPRGTSAGRSVLNNRTAGQRIAAGTIAAGITGGITAGFLGSEQSDQSQTDILNQTTGKNKTEASNLNKKDLQIIKFPPDIENSPVPHVLIKIYETETNHFK